MGNDLHPPNPSNPKGFFESAEINGINNDILDYSTGIRKDWWVEKFSGYALMCRPERVERIKHFTSKIPFCYKDPRFCYTLPVWKPYLKDTKILAIFRNPAHVIISMSKMGIDKIKAGQVYLSMYKNLFENIANIPIMFIQYDQMFSKKKMKEISAFLEASVDTKFPEVKLNRSKNFHVDIPIGNEVRSMYSKLIGKSHENTGTRIS